jgi:hypothetical protein
MMRFAITTFATSWRLPPLASEMDIVSLNEASVKTMTTRAASLR